MTEKESDYKQSEWNSNKETLKAIRNLINQAHNAAYEEDWDGFMRTLYRLYVEAQTMMDNNEKAEAKEMLAKMDSIINKYGQNLKTPYMQRSISTRVRNTAYDQGWQLLVPQLKNWELWLMSCLAEHKMLLTDQGHVEDEL